MASGYFLTGITTGNLINLIKRNGLGLHPKYLFRFSILLLYSFGTSFFKLSERLFYAKKIDEAACPEDIIIIIGHWRSGTTFLHQLFNAIPGFTTPTVLDIGTPESFLVSKKILSPIIQRLLPSSRSTDNVSLDVNEPQEDEFALFRATTSSPVEKLVFPEKNSFFLNDECDFIPSDPLEKRWKKTLITFIKKLSLSGGGKIVLKNPFHSMRIIYLKKLFPKAKFIHICRNPINVIPSTIRMWEIEGKQNCLRDGDTAPSLENAISIYNMLLHKIKTDLNSLPENDYCTIRFEDLENNPVDTIRDSLDSINLTLSNEQLHHLHQFVGSRGDYKKNRYQLPEEHAALIRSRLHHHIYE